MALNVLILINLQHIPQSGHLFLSRMMLAVPITFSVVLIFQITLFVSKKKKEKEKDIIISFDTVLNVERMK